MFEHDQGAERIGVEGQQGVVGVDLGRQLLREQHAWEDEGEVEMIGRCREDVRVLKQSEGAVIHGMCGWVCNMVANSF